MTENKITRLPSMQHTFDINIEGKETQKRYIGEFTYERPNLGKQVETKKMLARLNGDLKNLEPEAQLFNEMIATLYYGLIKSPDWWAECNYGQNLYDIEPIQEIFQEILKFEKEWRSKVYGEVTGPKVD